MKAWSDSVAVDHKRRWRMALQRFDRSIDEIVDYRALVPLRLAAGVMVVIQLTPLLHDSLSGTTYRDAFHIPVVAWYPELPAPAYIAALWIAAAGGVLMAAGLFTRSANVAAASFAAYHLFLSETHYHHNRAFLTVLLVGLALVPVGERVSLDAWLGRVRSDRPGFGVRWPLMLLRFQVGVVYAASGLSKLLDGDWIGGTVLRLRTAAQAQAALDSGVPAALVDLVTSSGFNSWFAKIVVGTELFTGLGLLWRRTRWAAVWVAIPFHVAIEMSAAVELFSYAGLAALVIWVTPRAGDRRLTVPPRWHRPICFADWTGRFSVDTGPSFALRERDGTLLTGGDAGWRTATLLPLTFWSAAPIGAARNWLGRRSRR